MTDIYEFLKTHNIEYQRFDHQAVYTCEEADKLCPDMPGEHCKNLFLRDRNGERHFLVIVSDKKSVDLKSLPALLNTSKLGFASPERLKKYLDLEPGSVSLLGIVNDQSKSVEVVIDQNLWDKPLLCHPLINTATLVIPAEGIKKILEITGHKYQVLHIPERIITA